MTENKNPIIGYMKGRTGANHNINVLVTIEVLPSAITDLERDDIIDPLNASYITNTIKLVKIIDEQLNEYSICTINGDEHKIGDVLFEEDETYRFYLSKKRAIFAMYCYNHVGSITSYYDNGQKEEEYFLTAKRKKHGNYKYWTEKGNLIQDINYLDGRLDGEYKEWEDNDDNDEEENMTGDYKPKLIKHILYSNGGKIEYLNSELAIEKINKIYDTGIKYINEILSKFNPISKFKKGSKQNKHDIFKTLISEIRISLEKLNKVISKNIDVITCNNLKKIDLIKKLYDTLNTEYGKSYLNVNHEIEQEIINQLDIFIIHSENKTEPEYQEFKVYLANMKQILFA
jgi:hypothetical protein